MPYISASIIIQMVAVVYPPWAEWRRKASRVVVKITQMHALFHASALADLPGARRRLRRSRTQGVVIESGVPVPVSLPRSRSTTGTMFLMWLGEQITERGIGNGISMIILSGIVAGLPNAIGQHLRVR
jgi:preprotein translocase subunit SecY